MIPSRVSLKQNTAKKWYDVLDKNNVWRIGLCDNSLAQIKIISFDGFHPNHNEFFCEHSQKIQPIRTHTTFLTTPQNPLRTVLTAQQLQNANNLLVLNSMKSSQLDTTVESVRVFIRTQILILVDKIMHTPFQIMPTIKMAQLIISKFFMSLIVFYLKMLQSAKKFIAERESNEVAKQLLQSMNELGLAVKMVLGLDPRSKCFYEDPLNQTIKSEGMMDCLTKSEEGMLPLINMFKGFNKVTSEEFNIVSQTIEVFISLCERQSSLLEDKNGATAKMLINQVMAFYKISVESSEELWARVQADKQSISRIETIYLKLYPNKQCPIRNMLQKPVVGKKQSENQGKKEISKVKNVRESKVKSGEDSKIKGVEERLEKLQSLLIKEQSAKNRKENMGEEQFLLSLEWALEAGDIETSRKLVKWRKNLIHLGKVVGWDMALAVGNKTYKQKIITPSDIISANLTLLRQ